MTKLLAWMVPLLNWTVPPVPMLNDSAFVMGVVTVPNCWIATTPPCTAMLSTFAMALFSTYGTLVLKTTALPTPEMPLMLPATVPLPVMVRLSGAYPNLMLPTIWPALRIDIG